MTKKSHKSSHIPTPYRVEVDNIGNNPEVAIFKPKHGFIATMGGGQLETRKATAKFIVQACNSRNSLVDSCNEMVAILEKIRFVDWPVKMRKHFNLDPEELFEAIQNAYKATAKAGYRQ